MSDFIDRLLSGPDFVCLTLNELAENATFYLTEGAPEPDEKAKEALKKGAELLKVLLQKRNGMLNLPLMQLHIQLKLQSSNAAWQVICQLTGQKQLKVKKV